MIVRTINDTGLALTAHPGSKIKELRVYCENGSVQFWVELRDGTEVMQYLEPSEAMGLSKALDRLAIEALRARS
jgi:hypothetical protein